MLVYTPTGMVSASTVMRGMLCLILGATSCSRPGPAADTSAASATSGSLSILTYNVHGLPEAITGDDTAGRMAQIAPHLNDFDVVGLQEDWDPDNRMTLLSASNHPTQLTFDEALEGRYYGSGLTVCSQYPSETWHHEHFTECNGVFDAASDCLASKGFQMVRLQLSAEQSIDLYNTHLEAGGSSADQAVRTGQVDQLLAAFELLSADRPIVFLGDTNLHAGSAIDGAELARIEAEAGLQDACTAVGCAEPQHIDRVFVRSSQTLALEVTSWTNEDRFVDAQGGPLSDHPAISAQLAWSIR